MSYIRYTQDGEYVDIAGIGSYAYVYDTGEEIIVEGDERGPMTYSEFAAMIGSLAKEIDIAPDKATAIRASFNHHFGGWDEEYSIELDRYERAEIFCQCLDSRIESESLEPEVHEAVQDWSRDE